MSAQPVTTALELAEDAILAALTALAPSGHAHWDGAPVGSVKALQLYAHDPLDPAGLSRVYVGQHQDRSGRRARALNSDGWTGLVVVRVQSGLDTQARAGLALVVEAMKSLAQPNGYRLTARYDTRIAIPTTDRIITRAAQWRITIRRTQSL